jgi:hypothetical protein
MTYGAPAGSDAVQLAFLSFIPALLLFAGFFCLFWPRQVVALSILLTTGPAAASPRLERLRSEAAARRLRAGGGLALLAGAGLLWVILGG